MKAQSISVVTVCRNASATLAHALTSIAAQDFGNVQHIIIDGASTDNTVEIARRQQRAGGIILSEPDRGIYDAMNKGVALATGDVIGFLNADDVYADVTVLSRVMAALNKDDINALFGDIAFFRVGDRDTLYRRYNSGRFRPSRLGWGWMPAHPASFVARDIFKTIGPFRDDYKIAGDFEFIARAFARGAISYHHMPEILVRMQAGGISTRDLKSRWIINSETVRACRENGIRSNHLMVATKYPLKLLELF